MPRTDDGEVAVIKRGELVLVESFDQREHTGIHYPEPQIGVIGL